MNAGVLQFALGLTTGGFLSGLEGAKSKLMEFGASIISVGAIYEGLRSALERGSELKNLSEQTGETIGDLYKLQEGFKAVGVDVSQLPNMLIRMQQSLSGIGRGSTATPLFQKLGLNVKALKNMGAAQQIDSITAALSKLDKQSATGAAAQMFGLETGALPFLQIVGSADDFHKAMEQVNKDAEVFERNAAAFDRFDNRLGIIKSHLSGLFAGVLSGIEPALEKVENKINNLDMSGLGEKLGKIISAFAAAWSSGQLTELIALSISTGFEAGFKMVPGLIEEIGYGLLKAFETPLIYLQAGFTYIEEKLMEWIYGLENKFPPWMQHLIHQDATGMKGFKADSFSQILSDTKDSGLQVGMVGLGDVQKDANGRVRDAFSKLPEIFAPLQKMIDGLAGKIGDAGLPASQKSGPLLTTGKNNYKPEFTSFEKMGFVMNGANPATQYARRTADNTQRIAGLMEALVNKISGPSPQPEHDL